MGSILRSIRNPRDLRQLPNARLAALADEMREVIVERFALREEYLASALGMTDLTIALHWVFDFSHDRLVFDLAHQAAAHLVLTRNELAGGESGAVIPGGFPGDEREPWDHFFAGHAGASVSKALGLAAGTSDQRKTVAVIGDGGVASGIALEALNSGQGFDRDVLVILNDNEMSISKVIGALGEILSKIRVGKTYNELKREAHKLLQAIPIVGERIDKAAEQLKDALAKALVPGALFEKMGPRYFGPVDGHNLAHLTQLLQEIRRQQGFYLLHVVTRREAAARPLSLGTERITRPEGEPRSDPAAPEHETEERPRAAGPSAALEFARQGEESWNAVLVRALIERMEQDPRAVLITLVTPELEGIGALAQILGPRFPDRVWNMKVNEPHGVAFAAGLCRAGRRPIVVSPVAYFHRAHDQVMHEVGERGLPVVFVLAYAGLVSAETTMHHGIDDLAVLRCVPGLDLMAPRDGAELDQMLRLSMELDGPSAIRITHGFAVDPDRAYAERGELARGRAEVLRRGSDLAILALGSLVYPAMEAAELLSQKGIEATVVNARFARPLDIESLGRLIAEHSLVFTAEEHRLAGGFGSAVLEALARERLAADRLVPIALPDGILARDTRSRLLTNQGLDPMGLADRILHQYRRWVRSGTRS